MKRPSRRRHGDGSRVLTGLVGHVVEVAVGVGSLVIDGGRDHALADGQPPQVSPGRRSDRLVGAEEGGPDGDVFAVAVAEGVHRGEELAEVLLVSPAMTTAQESGQ